MEDEVARRRPGHQHIEELTVLDAEPPAVEPCWCRSDAEQPSRLVPFDEGIPTFGAGVMGFVDNDEVDVGQCVGAAHQSLEAGQLHQGFGIRCELSGNDAMGNACQFEFCSGLVDQLPTMHEHQDTTSFCNCAPHNFREDDRFSVAGRQFQYRGSSPADIGCSAAHRHIRFGIAAAPKLALG